MDASHLPLALALAIIKKRRNIAAAIPVCAHCVELREALSRLENEVQFLRKKTPNSTHTVLL